MTNHTLIALLSKYCREIGVTRIGEVTMLDTHSIPVFQSIRPAATNLVVDSGKGETRDEALVATMADAIERFCGESCLNERVALKDIDSIEDLVFYPSLPFRRPLDDYLEVTAVKRYPDMKAFYIPFGLISYWQHKSKKKVVPVSLGHDRNRCTHKYGKRGPERSPGGNGARCCFKHVFRRY